MPVDMLKTEDKRFRDVCFVPKYKSQRNYFPKYLLIVAAAAVPVDVAAAAVPVEVGGDLLKKRGRLQLSCSTLRKVFVHQCSSQR
jgi:hypothetical protein